MTPPQTLPLLHLNSTRPKDAVKRSHCGLRSDRQPFVSVYSIITFYEGFYCIHCDTAYWRREGKVKRKFKLLYHPSYYGEESNEVSTTGHASLEAVDSRQK